MPVEYGQQSHYAKELRKWEATHTEFGAPGRPYTYQEFPKMLYLAGRPDDVPGVSIIDRCIVQSADEQRNMESRNYHATQQAALDSMRTEQLEHGELAAEREWAIQHGRLSAKAAAEVRGHEAEHGARHLPEIPRTPIKKRGRPVKVQVTTDA